MQYSAAVLKNELLASIRRLLFKNLIQVSRVPVTAILYPDIKNNNNTIIGNTI